MLQAHSSTDTHANSSFALALHHAPIQAVEELTGLSSAQLRGEHVQSIICEDSHQSFTEALGSAFAGVPLCVYVCVL